MSEGSVKRIDGCETSNSLTIGTALILISKVGAPACVASAEAQLGDGVTKEEYEGSTSRHSACLLRTGQDAAKGR